MTVIQTRIEALSLADLVQLLQYCMTMSRIYMQSPEKQHEGKKLQVIGIGVEVELKKRLDTFVLNIV